jgi:hypothetical protein
MHPTHWTYKDAHKLGHPGDLFVFTPDRRGRFIVENDVRAFADRHDLPWEFTRNVNPRELRWTQRTAGGRGRAQALRENMAARGWDGPPIDVVHTRDGLVTVDHTRAAIAIEMNMETIPVREHLFHELLPRDMVGRFGPAKTWGEAIAYRAANQRPPLPPTGTIHPPRLPP